jgi:myo-inositol-1(or 4)-monophosphatase
MKMTRRDFIIQTLKRAGEILMEEKKKKFEVILKNGNPNDVVTEVDFVVNNFIISEIQKNYPSELIYSEEIKNTVLNEKSFWTIDPIDGSSNFSTHIPHYAVCIGYVEDRVSVAGGIFNPMTNELFSFEKGTGAYLNEERIEVSKETDLKKACAHFRVGSKKENWDWGVALYRALLENSNRQVNFGSSGLDSAFVAAGRYEINIYGAMTSFDISCAIGLVREAGGVVVDGDYKDLELSFSRTRVIMANNREILEQLKAIGA